jgi:hypothetical protein
VNDTLARLRQDIIRVEATLHSHRDTQGASADLLADEDRIARNLRDLVRVAESFHSSASTIAAEGSVWGGSVIGDPMDSERFQNIQDWIPPPTVEEEDVDEEMPVPRNSKSAVQESPSETRTTSGSPSRSADTNPQAASDSESDFERDLLRNIEHLAFTSLDQRDYRRAGEFFKELRPQVVDAQNRLKMDLCHAYCCCNQGQWDEAQEIILPMATERGQSEIMIFHALHTIALYHYQTGRLDDAEKHCKRASLGKRRILGRKDESYYESLDILAQIHHDKGEVARAEGYRRFLPPNKPPRILQPLNYMEKSMLSYVDHCIPEDSSERRDGEESTTNGPGTNKSKLSKKNAAQTPVEEAPSKPVWEDAWLRKAVAPEEVQELLKGCTSELKSRGKTKCQVVAFMVTSKAVDTHHCYTG